jgi:hypothetical protein
MRFSIPRRADARRSCEPAFVHRTNRFFAGKRSHCNKSGGASAPRGMFSVCELETWKPSALRLQTWFPTGGGLTPVAGRKRPQLQLRYQTHGGLTPAALVNLRSCIAKIVFSPANVRTATRAGGVSPPWDVLGMRTRNVETQRVAVADVVSDRRRADACRWTKASAIATALPNPRRAHARRSCEPAFVHRTNRFFRRQTFALHQERGASAPRGMFSVCELET